MSALRKNVASQVITFCLVNATTGAALTGATVTTKVALDGTQSAGAGTLTELGTGQYKYVPTQGETNGASVGFCFTATNAVPVNLHCFTTSQDPTIAQTGDSFARIGAAGAGLTALGDTRIANLDATVSSRLATAGYTAPPSAATNASQVRTELTTELGRIDAAVSTRSTYAGADTAGTTTLLSRIASALTITGGAVNVNDKTGFSLSGAGVQAIWDALTSALTTVGSIGKLLVDRIDAAISSRSTYAGGDTSGVTTLLSRIVGTLATGTHNPQTGDSFARIGAAGAGLTALGDTRVANLDAAVSTRLATAGYTAPPSAAANASQVRTELTTELAQITLAKKILKNRTQTNPATGIMTVYDDDGTTPLLTANIYADVAATVPYDGTAGVNRRNALA